MYNNKSTTDNSYTNHYTPMNTIFAHQLTACWSLARLWGCLLGAIIGANSRLDGKSPGVLLGPLCSGASGMSPFMTELHRLPDTINGSVSSENENCRKVGEFSSLPPPGVTPGVTTCILSKLTVAVAIVLAAGDRPLLVTTDDRVVPDKPRTVLMGLYSCCCGHSRDKMSANLEHSECIVRLFLTRSALCRCLMEFNVHLYTHSGPLGRWSLSLAAAVQLSSDAIGFIKYKHKKLSHHTEVHKAPYYFFKKFLHTKGIGSWPNYYCRCTYIIILPHSYLDHEWPVNTLKHFWGKKLHTKFY